MELLDMPCDIEWQLEQYYEEEMAEEMAERRAIKDKLSRISRANLLMLVEHYYGAFERDLQRRHWLKGDVVEMLVEAIIDRGDASKVI
jgi:hypothetical protein